MHSLFLFQLPTRRDARRVRVSTNATMRDVYNLWTIILPPVVGEYQHDLISQYMVLNATL